jgi:predicted ATPase
MQREVAGHRLGGVRYEIDGFCVYSALRLSDQAEFLVKGPREDFPPLADVQRLENELSVLQRHRPRSSGILQALYRIDDNRNSYVVYEAFDGLPADVAGLDPNDLPEVCTFARGLMAALSDCHQVGLVHRGLTPRSILWDRVSQRLRLTHFVHATSGPYADQEPIANSLSPFSAPEQTGQLNVSVDHRADLYAAGAVLYHLLTGKQLFASTDSRRELAHDLVAREPVPIGVIRPDLDTALADLVSRLIAKSPDDRPKSSAEAVSELESIAAHLTTATAAPAAPAPPLIAPRMHGRQRESRELTQAITDAAAGDTRTVLLAGAAGSGKSRLIEELRAQLRDGPSLITCGKFDQYRRKRPYSALLDAVEGLLEHLLSGAEADLDRWRRMLETIEPALRGVLAEQIPQLHFVLGQQPAPPALGPAEVKNRFHHAFRALLDTLCNRAHPLVMVIDDLQWSDDETIALLSELFFKVNRPFLTLILVYRPKEAANAPNVAKLIADDGIRHNATTRRIELAPLPEKEVASLCAEVASPCRDPNRLANLVQAGCRGNPLFAMEILKRLRRTGGLDWVRQDGQDAWQLRAGDTTATPESESVVDLIVGRIDALPDECRRTIMAAACVGHAFQPAELSAATGLATGELETALRTACDEGLIAPDGPAARLWLNKGRPETPTASFDDLAFSFFHDRVQQAAHSLSSDAERRRLHLTIGRSFLARADQAREMLFAVVEHLNAVPDLLTASERERLTELNFVAGCAAKESIAYATATALFERALALAESGAAETRSDLVFKCRLHLAQSLYLGSNLERAEATFELALAAAKTTVQEVEVHRTRLILYQHMQRYSEAIALGLRALRLLGVRLPERPSPVRLAASLTSLLARARRADVDALARMPDRADEREHAVLDLLILLWTPTFWTNQRLNALIVVKLMKMTLRLGNTPQAPMAYVCFGILHHVAFKAHRRGLSFGKLAMQSLGESADPFVASRVSFLALTFFGPLQRDNRANVELYEQALARCLTNGEHVFGGHTIDGITTSLPIQGFRLPDIEKRLDACAVTAEQIASEPSSELIRVIRAWCRQLSKPTDVSSSGVVRPEDIRYDSYVGVHRMLQMATAYLWHDDHEVLRLAKLLRGNVVVQSNPFHASFYALFAALGTCRMGGRGAAGKANRLLTRLRRFAEIFPPNFSSLLRLAEAEVAAVRGDRKAALAGYHDAIVQASTRGQDLIHAIACERLASNYEVAGDAAHHQEYLAVAAYSYGRFGAAAKVDEMARRHPGIELTTQTRPLMRPAHQQVDLGVEAVMRAAYAIAEETRRDRLARNLLRVITTTAGGQRGFLVKPDGTRWVLLAGWEGDAEQRDFEGQPLEGLRLLSEPIVRYVGRTNKFLHLQDPARDSRFDDDPYLLERRPRSLLCLPLLHRGELSAVLYLENSVCADVFTDEQRQLATLLGHQAAISMAVADYHKVEMDALQAKINPHFLYNTLSVVSELIVKDPERAEAAVIMLSNLYRYTLGASSDQVVTLAQELKIARDYLTLEQYRFGDRLSVDFHVTGPVENVHVPALIFQPLVENSVRHGVARKVGPGRVTVEVTVSDEHCTLRVEDDGPGWKEPRSDGGFGLRSVQRRLGLLYQGNCELKITKSPGVCIEIKIPIDRSLRERMP